MVEYVNGQLGGVWEFGAMYSVMMMNERSCFDAGQCEKGRLYSNYKRQ